MFFVLSNFKYLVKKELAFITRVTEGTLEHMIELDYILDVFSKLNLNYSRNNGINC